MSGREEDEPPEASEKKSGEKKGAEIELKEGFLVSSWEKGWNAEGEGDRLADGKKKKRKEKR